MNDVQTTVNDLKTKVKQFVQERDWEPFHSPKNVAMSIAIEASELMEIFQWETVESAVEIAKNEKNEHVKEELADVLIYCMSFANALDIDISEAIVDKLKKNAIKYPVNKKDE